MVELGTVRPAADSSPPVPMLPPTTEREKANKKISSKHQKDGANEGFHALGERGATLMICTDGCEQDLHDAYMQDMSDGHLQNVAGSREKVEDPLGTLLKLHFSIIIGIEALFGQNIDACLD